MNNLNYDGWRYWVDVTYKGRPLKSVFMKLLDAWGAECDALRAERDELKARENELNVELDLNFIAKTKEVEDKLRAKLESTQESLRDMLRIDNELRVEAQKWHDQLNIAMEALSLINEMPNIAGNPSVVSAYVRDVANKALKEIRESQ